MPRTPFLLFAALLTACAAPAPQPSPQPPIHLVPAAPASALPRPAASSAAPSVAASAARPADLPLPVAPPGADPEKVAIAGSICAAAVWDSGMPEKKVGCRSHPPFTRPEQQPDGKLVTQFVNPYEPCSIDELYRGAFTRPGASQILLAFSVCLDPKHEFFGSNPGSAVLVEKVGDRYQALAYVPDVDLFRCLQDRKSDGHDVLVCKNSRGGIHTGGLDWFFDLDFTRPASNRTSLLAKVFSDECDYPCTTPYAAGFAEDGAFSFKVTSFTLKDVNHDGKKDLVAAVQRAFEPNSPAFRARIAGLCKGRTNDLPARSYFPRPAPATLEFLGTDQGFAAAPATQKLLATWTAQTPEGNLSVWSNYLNAPNQPGPD